MKPLRASKNLRVFRMFFRHPSGVPLPRHAALHEMANCHYTRGVDKGVVPYARLTALMIADCMGLRAPPLSWHAHGT